MTESVVRTVKEKRAERKAKFAGIGCLLMIIFGFFMVTWSGCGASTIETVVKKTDHKFIDGVDTYMVFTESGVFVNRDVSWRFKWNSSDVQNELMNGGKYRIKYYGWRVPFMSWYPNIISAKKIE